MRFEGLAHTVIEGEKLVPGLGLLRCSGAPSTVGACAGAVKKLAVIAGGEPEGTPLELFSSGILELEPQIRELIRAAA